LGHVFLDGPKPNSVEQDVLLGRPEADPRGSSDKSPLPRFCINGAALTFEERSSST
jgi:peptide methionine sulfoxide reductase MsrB